MPAAPTTRAYVGPRARVDRPANCLCWKRGRVGVSALLSGIFVLFHCIHQTANGQIFDKSTHRRTELLASSQPSLLGLTGPNKRVYLRKWLCRPAELLGIIPSSPIVLLASVSALLRCALHTARIACVGKCLIAFSRTMPYRSREETFGRAKACARARGNAQGELARLEVGTSRSWKGAQHGSVCVDQAVEGGMVRLQNGKLSVSSSSRRLEQSDIQEKE